MEVEDADIPGPSNIPQNFSEEVLDDTIAEVEKQGRELMDLSAQVNDILEEANSLPLTSFRTGEVVQSNLMSDGRKKDESVTDFRIYSAYEPVEPQADTEDWDADDGCFGTLQGSVLGLGCRGWVFWTTSR